MCAHVGGAQRVCVRMCVLAGINEGSRTFSCAKLPCWGAALIGVAWTAVWSP